MSSLRPVNHIVQTHRQTEGAGFVVRRPFPTQTIDSIDPFLLLDEMGPVDYAPGKAVGAPDHPHRGFETVTYMLEGEFVHEDSAGNRGELFAGDVQWMTAGDGVIHSEEPSPRIQREGGRVHGFQIWVNLPSHDKRMEPRYQDVPSARIPVATSPDGKASVKVIAGEALGVNAVIDTRTPIVYHDWTLQPGARVEVPVPADHRMMAYVFGGSLLVSGKPVADGQLAVFGEGDHLAFEVPENASTAARLLLLGGKPLNEPVARYGPFVMNTRAEIQEAFEDYQSGRFGLIKR